MRNHIQPPAEALQFLKALTIDVNGVKSLEQLLGIEGIAARTYFEHFSGMIKIGRKEDPLRAPWDGDDEEVPDWLSFDFKGRNRRPPRDPVNALLSLGYSLLAKDLTVTCAGVGLDPYLGFYHQPRFGRPALALDLMEPFRALIVDSAVLSAINQRMVQPQHFVSAGNAVALTPDGRKAFFRAYEQRMDQLVTHPVFSYRVSYRRVLEIQVRLLARLLMGEIWQYPSFVTR
jgi:CRISPR-associated protein Cas1